MEDLQTRGRQGFRPYLKLMSGRFQPLWRRFRLPDFRSRPMVSKFFNPFIVPKGTKCHNQWKKLLKKK